LSELILTCDDSNGVLQPYKHLGWWKWMYRVSPYTYLIEGLIGQGEAFLSRLVFVCIKVLTPLQHLGVTRLPAHQSSMSRSIHLRDKRASSTSADSSMISLVISRTRAPRIIADSVNSELRINSYSSTRIFFTLTTGATLRSCGYISDSMYVLINTRHIASSSHVYFHRYLLSSP
jgi:hypothetical protein